MVRSAWVRGFSWCFGGWSNTLGTQWERCCAAAIPHCCFRPCCSTIVPPMQSHFGRVVHYPEKPLSAAEMALNPTAMCQRCAASHCSSPFHSSGFLRGEQSAEPQLIAFHPCFEKGALLTVVSAAPALFLPHLGQECSG